MFDLKKIQQIQRDLQDRMEKIQEELGRRMVEGTAGGGAVTVICNGRQEIQKIKIKPEAVDPKDIEMLEDLVLAAANDAVAKAKELHEQMVTSVTGGIKVPGLF